jgi:hypothetical protein
VVEEADWASLIGTDPEADIFRMGVLGPPQVLASDVRARVGTLGQLGSALRQVGGVFASGAEVGTIARCVGPLVATSGPETIGGGTFPDGRISVEIPFDRAAVPSGDVAEIFTETTHDGRLVWSNQGIVLEGSSYGEAVAKVADFGTFTVLAIHETAAT